MADKIVILEDKDGNNIYPITRGLAANSVDTNAIQNGAVTSDKIDSTTLYSNSSGGGLGQIFLSDSIQNYKEIAIEYRDSVGNCALQRLTVVPGVNNKTTLSFFEPGWGSDQTFYIRSAEVSIIGSTLAISSCKVGVIPNSGTPTVTTDSSTEIKVYSVIGYK